MYYFFNLTYFLITMLYNVFKMVDKKSALNSYHLVRILLGLLYELVDTISSGAVIQIDERLNKLYLSLCERLENLTENKFTRPFPSLFSIGQNIDVEWNEGGRMSLLDFKSKLKPEDLGNESIQINEDRNFIREAVNLIKSLKGYKAKTEIKFNQSLTELENDLESGESEKRFCSLEGDTFTLYLSDGSKKAITFNTKEKSSNQMLAVFRELFEHWQKTPNKVTPRKLIGKALHEGNVNDVVSNLRRKIEARGLSENVILGSYVAKDDGYLFEIIKPTPTA